MRKVNQALYIVLLVCSLFISTTAFAAATHEADTVVSLQIDNPIMYINGDMAEIDEGRGTKPIITDGRTLVPIRAIIEAFGGAVHWENHTRTVTLIMEEDIIKLIIDSKTAYLNNQASTLDVAPSVMNERTMLPIRYIAESFNLGVAWEDDTRTVSIIRNRFDDREYDAIINRIPAYEGQPHVQIGDNKPFFKDYEMIGGSFEFYADLDEYGRCNVAMASIGPDLMPVEERESISAVKPTGWVNTFYDTVDGGYLYNRCHLIGFQLTGENANERNLITGTRYLNMKGMLPFENRIDDYIEATKNHVIYRVTPIFRGNNLVAEGVLLEAYSVEDKGQGISFCVYCYNVQPSITIDYATGASYKEGATSGVNPNQNTSIRSMVYRTPSGKKYHFSASCGGKNSYEVTMQDAENAGLTPCSKCAQ